MSFIRDFIKKHCYTPNSLRHDLEGELVFQHLEKEGPFETLLDAGAGGGGYTVEIIKRKIAKKAIAVEADSYNYAILEQRTQKYGDNITTHKCYLEETPIERNSVDAVICNQVLEHIEDDHKAAQKLVDCLKNQGVIVVSVPRSPVALPQAEHVRDGYTEEEFSMLFESKGMEVLRLDWFYTEETQKLRSFLRKWTKKKIFLPKFLFKVKEMKISPEERLGQRPMGLILVARKVLHANE